MMKDAGTDEYLNEWSVLVFPSVEKSYQYQYAWCLGPSLRCGFFFFLAVSVAFTWHEPNKPPLYPYPGPIG